MRTRIVPVCLLILSAQALSLAAGEAYVAESPSHLAIGNDALEVRLDRQGERVRLAAIRNKRGRSPKLTDEGFLLIVNKTEEVPAAAFRLVGSTVESLEGGGKRLTILLGSADAGLEVRAAYTLNKGDFFARRVLAVRSTAGKDVTLYQAQVERLATDAELAIGGRGQPVFVGGGVFLGLEHPAAMNEISGGKVCLRHYPGRKLTKKFLALKSEVIGVSGEGDIEEAFAEYVRRIRVPPRSFILYNSWYDIRRRNMSNQAFIECFEGFREHLTGPYGVKLDSFVIDDGYQDFQSIWKTDRKVLPEDFKPLADHLRANGSRFGLWMPLTPPAHKLDLKWGRQQGYEVLSSGSHYCISGPKFNRALREIIAYHVREFGLNYYKHDFNGFGCAAEGHGHLPVAECGFEANVDAYIDVLKYIRTLNPDVFLNITSAMWLSPWWLMEADAVWRGGGDTGRERLVPYVQQRDDTMTYVDGVLWDKFVKHRRQFPPSALMTHGIVYGRLHMLGGRDEPLHRWAEHVIDYLAPGLMMIELYITPSILTDEQWAVLGPALAWARQEAGVLVETRMTHGNPHRGEVYGYRHTKAGRLIWFVRNPSMTAQRIEMDLARWIGGRPAEVAVTYPYRLALTPREKIEIDVPPYQTMVVEASAKLLDGRLRVEGCRYAVAGAAGRQITCDLIGPPGARTKVRLHSPAPIRQASLDGDPLPGTKGTEASFDLEFAGTDRQCTVRDVSPDPGGARSRVRVHVPPGASDAQLAVLCEKTRTPEPVRGFQLNGRPVKPKVVQGEGWRFFLVALPEGDAEVAWEVPTAEATRPFAAKSVTTSTWLFLRRGLARRRLVLTLDGDLPADAAKHLPAPFAHVDPVCLPVQPQRVVRTVTPPRTGLTEAELKTVRGAKLHVCVFDADATERYRNKPVLLNGEAIGLLPGNRRPINRWEEKIVDVPADKLGLLRTANTVVFTNPPGDMFKITEIGLAVQLADGTWVESNRETAVHCSAGGWAYTEGTLFKDKQSQPITLRFASGAGGP